MSEKKMKLQLTNGYKIQFEQFTRVLHFLFDQSERKIIPQKEFLEFLGMALKQFENLSSVMVGLGLMKARTLILTALGKMISEHDRYFDTFSTLWILHYIISNEPKWIVWNCFINRVLHENENITSPIALPYYSDLKAHFSEKSIREHIPKEIQSVFHAYTEQKFSRLNLFKKNSEESYKRSEPVDIEPLPFLYALLQYRDIHFVNATALVIEDIIQAENSPGRVFFLTEEKVNLLISRLHDMNLVRMETFGDLSQVRFAEKLSKEKVLEKIYGKGK